jgi:hypothetical protein
MFSFLFGRKKKRTTRRKTIRKRAPCRRRFRRSNVAGSSCNIKSRSDCLAKPFCNYVRGGQGCKYIPGGRELEGGMGGMVSAEPEDIFHDASSDIFGPDEPLSMFGRKKRCDAGKKRRKTRRKRSCRIRRFSRANVPGSSCNSWNRETCMTKPFCNYVRGGQGCKYIAGGRELEAGMGNPGGNIFIPDQEIASTMGGIFGADEPTMGMSPEDRQEAGRSGFGRRRRCRSRRAPRRYNVAGSPCNRLRRGKCAASGCSYTKRGCRRKATYKLRGMSFGARRYNVAGSSCNKKKKADCKSSGCTYTKRGCRRKAVYKLRTPKVSKRKSRKSRKSDDSDVRTGDVCRKKSRAACGSNPNCKYTKTGCRRRHGVKSRGVKYEGPMMEFGSKIPKSLARQCRSHGIKLTMKRGNKRVKKSAAVLKRQLRKVSKRRTVTKRSESNSRTGDVCRKRSMATCGGNPNCTYTKTGCRRRHGVKSGGVKYQGPMMEFGKRRGKKLPKAFVKKCRKYGVKTTLKRGRKRVQKSMSVLKKQLRRAMRSRR